MSSSAGCTSAGHHTYLLDGDNVRHGLNQDLGFTDADRVENIRRVAEVAKLMVDAGLIVHLLVHLAVRRRAADRRAACSDQTEFFEIFVDTPLAVAEARDPKGLYQRRPAAARLTTSPASTLAYEAPEHPEFASTPPCSRAEERRRRVIAAPCSRRA